MFKKLYYDYVSTNKNNSNGFKINYFIFNNKNKEDIYI